MPDFDLTGELSLKIELHMLRPITEKVHSDNGPVSLVMREALARTKEDKNGRWVRVWAKNFLHVYHSSKTKAPILHNSHKCNCLVTVIIKVWQVMSPSWIQIRTERKCKAHFYPAMLGIVVQVGFFITQRHTQWFHTERALIFLHM